jgi:tetratricopeptide (TPR) repeat protein
MPVKTAEPGGAEARNRFPAEPLGCSEGNGILGMRLIAARAMAVESTLGIPLRLMVKAHECYDACVKGIADGFASEYPEARRESSPADAVGEKELFTFLSGSFYSNFRLNPDAKLLTSAMLGKGFNCYSSSALLAGACERLGKRVSLLRAPGHVLLAGEKFALETTLAPEESVVPRAEVGSSYPFLQEAGVGQFLCAAYNWVGKEFARKGNDGEALRAFDKALSLSPRDLESLCNKGVMLEGMGRSEEAIACLSSALDISPLCTTAWYFKGNALKSLGEFEAAVNCFEEAISAHGEFLEAWEDKGMALIKAGRLEEAVHALSRATEISPGSAFAWYNKGFALGALGRNEEAVSAYSRSIELDRADWQAWQMKGTALFKAGRPGEALESFDAALRINPSDANSWNNRGVALNALGRAEEARQSFLEALKISPDDGIALANLGNAGQATSARR